MKNSAPDYLNLLIDISDLADLVTGSSDLESFLDLSVDLVARHFNAPVCSIYLYEETTKRLTLKATKGLKKEAVDKIHMKPGEGLVGKSFETLSIVREGNASKNPFSMPPRGRSSGLQKRIFLMPLSRQPRTLKLSRKNLPGNCLKAPL